MNLLDLEEPEWNATRTKLPRILENVEVTIPSPNRPLRIYFLSPDLNDGWPEELRFSYQNGIISFNLPRLEYWDMIILEQ
ncbi:MAG: glycoside hydrolase family 66 protein [Actinobacteria bacterium]|nr:glycoside hydrolase family 66 protein [Actinomycetota bacterium]